MATSMTPDANAGPVPVRRDRPDQQGGAMIRAGVRRPHGGHVNVGDTERWLSTLGGGALMLFGLSRRSLPGLALAAVGGSLVYRGVSGHSELYHALGLNTAEKRGPATSVPAGHGVKVEKAVTVANRSPEELYRFWRNFANLPRFMGFLESVTTESDRHSHWVARAPMGATVSWDLEVFRDEPGRLIAWRSLPGSTIDTAGSVHFDRSPGLGAEVRVSLKVNPPAGKLGAAVAGLFGEDPERLIDESLGRFKQLMEGGAPATAARPAGGQKA
jgi:uncharacterized membrane protein